MPPDSNTFAGKLFVVTGASSGVGLAIATSLSAQGANVHAVSRRAVAKSSRLIPWQVDLADTGAIDALCVQLRADGTHIHALIHCAGDLERRSIADRAVDDAERQFKLMAQAPMRLTTGLLPQLRAGRADVVFVNSSAVLRPARGVSAYAMAKSALVAFADALRAEENEHGLRVLTIYLGRTDTDMQRKLSDQERRAYHGERLIPTDDVAQLVSALLLLSDRTELTELTLRPREAPLQ